MDEYCIKVTNASQPGISVCDLVVATIKAKCRPVVLLPQEVTHLKARESVLLSANEPEEKRPAMIIGAQPELKNVSNECVAIEIGYVGIAPESVGHRLLLNPGETAHTIFLHEDSDGVIVKVCEHDSLPSSGPPLEKMTKVILLNKGLATRREIRVKSSRRDRSLPHGVVEIQYAKQLHTTPGKFKIGCHQATNADVAAWLRHKRLPERVIDTLGIPKQDGSLLLYALWLRAERDEELIVVEKPKGALAVRPFGSPEEIPPMGETFNLSGQAEMEGTPPWSLVFESEPNYETSVELELNHDRTFLRWGFTYAELLELRDYLDARVRELSEAGADEY